MRALLVDDEPLARRRLRRLIEKRADVEVVGEAENGREALEAIERLRPDVVFLDIRMPGLDGLAVARAARDLPPIVFTTAYDAHAVDAFETNAVDYPLKPIDEARLARALDRVEARRAAGDAGRLRALLGELLARTPDESTVRITSRLGNSVRLFDARTVPRFHASDRCTLFLADGEEHIVDESLNALEARLAPLGFVRVHRGELVNLGRVRELRSEDGALELHLDDGQVAPVSRRYAVDLRRRLGLASEE